MTEGKGVAAVNMNLHLLMHLIILRRLSQATVEGKHILHFCTSGYVNDKEVIVIKNRENTSMALECICDLQWDQHVTARISFDFPQTPNQCDESITYGIYLRCSRISEVYKNTSFAWSESVHTILRYHRNESDSVRRTGYVKINLTTTGANNLSVKCISGPRTIPDSELDQKSVIMMATFVPVLTVVAAVVILTILCKRFEFRRRAKYDQGGESSDGDLHEATYSLAEPDYMKKKKHNRKKNKCKETTAENESHEKSFQSADVYAQPIKEVKKGGKAKSKGDVQEPDPDDYQEVTVPVPAKSKELMAATMYDDVRVVKSQND